MSLMLDDILLQVNKPGRYIGGEWNMPKKDFDKAGIKFALCFPDLYELGMSNLGIRIIYGILNNIEDVCCERFFCVDSDMEGILRKQGKEIFSLESRKRLKEFDIIGFSLGHELSYTNVLNMLDLGRIPLRASLRESTHPLIIGGGPCALNPEPLSEFFDLFFLGEAEEAISEIIDIYRRLKVKFKTSQITKQDLLMRLCDVEGVYAPSFYAVEYNEEGKIKEFRPRFPGVALKIKKRILKNLDSAFFPFEWLVPNIAIVHDRIILEIMRGCPNTCRFCQGRSQYFPFRQKDSRNVLNLASSIYKSTGYEEISLAGLSVSDYPGLECLFKSLVEMFKEKAVSISLPSLKPKAMIGNLPALTAAIKKTSLTFAPEAGSQRLRKVLAKNFDTQSFFNTIEQAYICGWRHIKLYFMIGLPFEEDPDLEAIVAFSNSVSQLRKKIDKSPAQVNISINTLIPKPHTPFQWRGMADLESIRHKQDYLRSKAKSSKLKLTFHNRYMSMLEGVLSRGDRRLSEVILCAFRNGARFDGWQNHFRFGVWQDAFQQSGIDPGFYLQTKPPEEIFPWDVLDVGISKETLRAEHDKLIAMR